MHSDCGPVDEKSKFAFDITAYLSSPRKTGIQRVVADILQSSATQGAVLLQFDKTSSGYREVELNPDHDLSVHVGEALGSDTAAWRLIDWLWSISSPARRTLRLEGVLNPLARQFYSRKRSLQIGDTGYRQIKRWSSAPSRIGLLDIPSDPDHIAFLEKYVEGGSEFTVFLYDLMPTKTSEIWSSDLNRAQMDGFARYMNLVLKATRVVCLSEFTQSEYLAYRRVRTSRPQTIVTSYPPVSFDPEAPGTAPTIDKNRKEARDRNGSLSVMAVAPLLRRKNLRVLFSALLNLANQRGQQILLRLVCPASSAIDLEAWKSLRKLRQNRLVEVEYYRDIPDTRLKILYSESQVVAVPSLYEGFGLPLVEAADAGASVIAADIPVFQEIAKHLEVRLRSGHCVREWEDALLDAAGEPRKSQDVRGFLPSVQEFLETLCP